MPDPYDAPAGRKQVEQEIKAAAVGLGWGLEAKQRWGRWTRLIFRPDLPRLAGSLRVTLIPRGAEKTTVELEGRALTPRLAARAWRELASELGWPLDTVPPEPSGSGRLERRVVRVTMGALLAAAVAAAIVLSTPTKCVLRDLTEHGPACADGKVAVPDLPPFAFGQIIVYHVEIAVLLVLAGLLVATPAIIAILRGEMPRVEVSREGISVGDTVAASDTKLQENIDMLKRRMDKWEPDVTRLLVHVAQPHTHNDPS